MSWLVRAAKEEKPAAVFDSETATLTARRVGPGPRYMMDVQLKTMEPTDAAADLRSMAPQIRKFVSDYGEVQLAGVKDAKWLGDLWAAEGLASHMIGDNLILSNGFSDALK